MTCPYTTVVADFEYHRALLPILRHEAVFEVAIANAKGSWVIPPVTINHQVPLLQLHNKLVRGLKLLRDVPTASKPVSGEDIGTLRHQLEKFYGPYASSCTSSLTWGEIAELLDEYTQVSV